jgi:aspartyl protease family protein
MKRLPLFIIIFISFIVFTLLLKNYKPDSFGSNDILFNAIYSVLLISLMGSSLILHYRGRVPDLVKHVAIWGVIIIVIAAGYHFRFHFEPIKNTLTSIFLPSHPVATSQESITIHKSENGHFHVSAQANSKPVEFVVDTGASQTILTARAAKRIGIDIASLKYTQVYNTANGTVHAAPVTIKTLTIGTLTFHDIPASVNQSDMNTSLLGMSFLNLLSGYEVSGDKLTLKK